MKNPADKTSFKNGIAAQIDYVSTLEWRARNYARGLSMGKHNSRKMGVGMEFNQFRNYVQGDDTRLLDWKMYAKTQQYYIRQSDIETNHQLHISIDNSTSMNYAEDETSKLDLSKTIVATLTYIVAQQADQFSWNSGKIIFRKSQGLKNWKRSVIELDKLHADKSSNEFDLNLPLRSRSGIHLWITDLYLDTNEFERYIRSHSNRKSELILFHIVGRKEEALDFNGNTKFIDLESGETMHINAKKLKATYKKAFGQHVHQIKRFCQNNRVVYRKIYLQSELKNEIKTFLSDYNSL